MIPLVVHVVDLEGGTAEQFAFLRSPVRIGRGELNDLPLPKLFVSTYHGLVRFDDEGARYIDLGSTNGSVLDGVGLAANAPTVLAPGAELVIGTYQVRFERRVTGEQVVVPRQTMFDVRVATMAGGQLGEVEHSGIAASAASKGGVQEPLSAEVFGARESAPGPPAEVTADAEAALDAASVELDVDYASYRGSWEHLRSNLERVVAPLAPDARRAVVNRLATKYAALRNEPQFGEIGGISSEVHGARASPVLEGVGPGASARDAGLGEASLRLLRVFVESYLPGEPTFTTPEEIESVLGRVAGALETFARSFLELRRGHDEFGRQMGVRTVQTEGPLHRTHDPGQVLTYVLDPAAHGRDAELRRAFAEFMIHQVALVRGVADGARALLARFSPEAILLSATRSAWPMRAARLWRWIPLWKEFERRFHDLADEESSVSKILFGKEFARAYTSMAGQAPGDDD